MDVGGNLSGAVVKAGKWQCLASRDITQGVGWDTSSLVVGNTPSLAILGKVASMCSTLDSYGQFSKLGCLLGSPFLFQVQYYIREPMPRRHPSL